MGCQYNRATRGEAAVVGTALYTHAGQRHRHTGAPMQLAPQGGAAPTVTAAVPAAVPAPANARLVPAPGPGRSSQQSPTPRKRDARQPATAKKQKSNVLHYPVRDWAAAGLNERCAPAIVAATPADIRPAARQNVPRLLAAAREAGLTPDQTAYVLATAEGESDFGASMVERKPKNYAGRLGNSSEEEAARFIGHGFVQLTGRDHYAAWSKILGVDLVKHPELANDPDRSATIITFGMRDASFTGLGLDRFINSSKVDYIHARQIVNGMDRARFFARRATVYQSVLRSCSGDSGSSPPTPPAR